MAAALRAVRCPVLLADSNWAHVSAARLAGLPTYYGSVLSEHALDELDLGETGRLLALTSNDEVNSLACLRFVEVFGRREVYQLPFQASGEGRREAVSPDQRGRFLFGLGQTYEHLSEQFGENSTLKTTRLTREFDYAAFQALHGEAAVPLFLIKETGEVLVFAEDESPTPEPGQVLISLLSGASGAAAPRFGASLRAD
jgi:hypothetical protein